MKYRVYVDASVIGGCEDDEFAEHSVWLMDCFESGEFVLVLSGLTLQELALAPDAVRQRLAQIPESHVEMLEVDSEARALSDAYIAEGVISKKMLADTQYIAIATVGRVDVLVSWNFRHIVNLQRIRGFNAVNKRLGYPEIEIRAPQ